MLFPSPLTASGARRFPAASLLLSIVSVGIFVLPGASEFLQLDRQAIKAGELWRIFTCHLTHFTWEHLFYDSAVFAVLGALCQRLAPRRAEAAVLLSAGFIPLAVAAFQPGMQTYRGLSGLDSALFALLAVELIQRKAARKEWRWVAVLTAMSAGFAAKIAFESVTGSMWFVADAQDFVPVPLAHAVGAGFGAVAGLWPTPKPRRHPRQSYESERCG